MKTKINLSVLLVILIFTSTFFAGASSINVTASGKISGNVRNATSGLPLENATVTLFSTSDSSMVAGTISDTFGNFYISMLDSGRYFLVISETGFEKQNISQLSILDSNQKIQLGEVILNPVCEIRRKPRNR